VLLFGLDCWVAYLQAFSGSPAIYQSGRIDFTGMVNVASAVRLAGGGPSTAYVLQGATALICAVAVAFVWRRGAAWARPATLLAATAASVPLMLLYDLVLAGFGALLLVAPLRKLTVYQGCALAAVILAPLLCRPVAWATSIQVAPLASLLLLGLCVSASAGASGGVLHASPRRGDTGGAAQGDEMLARAS
jgi:hypothetical protein